VVQQNAEHDYLAAFIRKQAQEEGVGEKHQNSKSWTGARRPVKINLDKMIRGPGGKKWFTYHIARKSLKKKEILLLVKNQKNHQMNMGFSRWD